MFFASSGANANASATVNNLRNQVATAQYNLSVHQQNLANKQEEYTALMNQIDTEKNISDQVAAIEAVRWVANEQKTQEEMKQWLLKQKQAQVWDTPIATTDAVYALLTTGRDWLANTGEGKILMSEGKNKICEDEIKKRAREIKKRCGVLPFSDTERDG